MVLTLVDNTSQDTTAADEVLAKHLTPLTRDSDLDGLIADIGDAECVCIGEASHGTEEFYEMRARISRRLIEEHGFRAIAAESDWPDSWRVNQYAVGDSADDSAEEALSDFGRFPTWMWRNEVVADFVEWLREHNAGKADTQKCGFYGLDIYSLSRSAEAVISYLEQTNPAAAARARERYSCFEQFEDNLQAYGYATALGLSRPCQDEVLEQLVELQENAANYLDGSQARDAYFYAKRNAEVTKNAEHYYRSMFESGVSSWNLRDTHMMETLEALRRHQREQGRSDKVIVWAHNSHLGDARATEVRRHRELNLGQLARQAYGDKSYLLGFSTYQGTVTAASDWDGEAERKRVRPALPGSYEALMHRQELPSYYFFPARPVELKKALLQEQLQRAIGVIYRPETERASHYYHVTLPEQFDAMIHIDTTRAVAPLEKTPLWHEGEAYETYPSGL